MRIFINHPNVEGEEDQEISRHSKVRFCLGPDGNEQTYVDVFINTRGTLTIRSGDDMTVIPKFGNCIEIGKA